MDYNIDPFITHDLQFLPSLQPQDWNDIVPMWQFYLSCGFCQPIKISINGQMVGIGTSILHGDTAWLAHIIVHPDFRNKGIGSLITKQLIAHIDQTQYSSIQLIATHLGEPVYHKLGFEKTGSYQFLSREELSLPAPNLEHIIDFDPKYRESILKLDEEISGEKRKKVLFPHLEKCKIIVTDGALHGFYAPTLGEGLIIADSDAIGIELMKLKFSNINKAVIPSDNTIAIDYLLRENFEKGISLSRMQLGRKIRWKAKQVYNRIGGNLG